MVPPPPTVRPVGLAVLMVMVTVLVLSLALKIALVGPAQIDARPVVQAGGGLPARHPGIPLGGAVDFSVPRFYHSPPSIPTLPRCAPTPPRPHHNKHPPPPPP